ncbi:hypothetical protein H5410_003269 [Solanum commersonii]|uniref:Uncharacterized protein n=1 Tax=Solanum commersonii TaxID=4109 RepID=A0A9J6B4K1_SOLCO|nr:hypothetical protein H5410_003269 [Solanum commersonii]
MKFALLVPQFCQIYAPSTYHQRCGWVEFSKNVFRFCLSKHDDTDSALLTMFLKELSWTSIESALGN